MIDFIKVRKGFGTQLVLDEVTFRIAAGERVGVVGPNGAGKSTIFSLLTGELEQERGDVQLLKGMRIGHLKQQLNAYEISETLLGYTLNAIPELHELEREIHQLEAEGGSANLKRVGTLQEQFEHLGGYELKSRAEAALSGLGFAVDQFDAPFQTFSGGWQMRAELARVLIGQPDVLLLDEPSNFLDLPAVEWLQRFLRAFTGTMLLISHDRWLLRSLANVTLEVSGGDITKYQGGFDYYMRERESRFDQQCAAYANYLEKREQIEGFIRRFRAKSTKAAQVQSRVKQLEKMEVVKEPARRKTSAAIRIPPPPHSGAKVLSLQGASFRYEEDSPWIFKDFDWELNKGDKVAIVGFNGMGKTTLLRSLAKFHELTEGKRILGHKVVIGYQSQETAETMPPNRSVLEVAKSAAPAVPERDVRNLLGSFGFTGDAVSKSVKVLSGGEKIRLAFARIFISPPNLLLLDEPTTHLDIEGCEALENAIRDYQGTVCLVSHDITFVRNTAEKIVSVSPGAIESISGNYDYFLEKTSGQKIETVSATERSESASPAEKGKDARKARAAQREAQKAVRKIERSIEKLTKEQTTLHDELITPTERTSFTDVQKRLADISAEIETLEMEWLEESEKADA